MRVRTVVVLMLAFLLTSCSGERRQVGQYLTGLDTAVLPAVQQGKVVQQLASTTNRDNFMATWPVLRKNLQDLQTQVGTASASLKSMTVPAPAETVHQLATQDLDTLGKLCAGGLDMGDRITGAGKGLAVLKVLAELRPQLDELKQEQAQHVELTTRLENEIGNLKRAEGL